MFAGDKEVLISKLGPKKPEIDPGQQLQFMYMISLMRTWLGCIACIMQSLPPHLEHDCEATMLVAGKGQIVSEHYSLLPCDLRNLKDLDDAVAKAELDAK